MLSDFELMEWHVAALFRLDRAGRLTEVNEPGPPRPGDRPAPRLFLGRTTAGNLWRFRHDLPPGLAHEIERILAEEPVVDDLSRPPVTFQRLLNMMAADTPIEDIWQGPAWYVPEEVAAPDNVVAIPVSDPAVLRKSFAWLTEELEEHRPCWVVLDGDDAVALCCSSRLSPVAAEAGVDTVAEFRGRGFASAVVAAWAQAVRGMGRLPLYSTSWDNHASQAVSRRLGLVLYGADLHIT